MSDPTPNALTVPMDEHGNIGTLPDPLQKFIDGKIADALRRGKEKGLSERAAQPNPVEVERLRQLEEQVKAYEIQEAERRAEYEKALKLREDDYTKTTTKLQQEVSKREARLKAALAAEIRAAAVTHGAREQSLAELQTLLAPRLGLTEALDPVVLGDDGQPSDRSIEDLVKGYLDAHPHHRAAPVAGGGARGGASFQGQTLHPRQQRAAEAIARIRADRSDLNAINELFEATRSARSS